MNGIGLMISKLRDQNGDTAGPRMTRLSQQLNRAEEHKRYASCSLVC